MSELGSYLKDLAGHTVLLRESIPDKRVSLGNRRAALGLVVGSRDPNFLRASFHSLGGVVSEGRETPRRASG